MKRLAIAALIAAPVALTFVYVRLYGVNVPFWDEWELVPLYERFYTHQLGFADLFAQHNEHRIFFPRLIMLALGNVYDGNPVAWMYASAVLLVATGAALYAQQRRLYGEAAALSFVPVAWLLFTLRQAQNLVWGFQVTLVLCTACFVGAAVLLRTGGMRRLWLAAGLCFISTFSAASGLLAWVALFALLVCRRLLTRLPWSMLATWAALALATFVVYFHGYVAPVHARPPVSPLADPLRTLYIFLGTMGGGLSADVRGAAAAGGATVLLFLLLAAAARNGALDFQRALPAVPLLFFAVGSAALVAVGRGGYQLIGVSNASRFVTMTMPGVIGLYLALLAVKGPLRQTASGVFAGILLLAVFASFDGSFENGEEYKRQRLRSAEVLRDLAHHPDQDLTLLFWRAATVRERAPILARYKLSVFAE
jgi:hypothetical protein